MSSHHDHHPDPDHHGDHAAYQPQDSVEAILPVIPVVLPLVGALLMFLLAFIAVHMA